MTFPDARKLLNEQIEAVGQAEVSRRLGISTAAICQLVNGKYHANPDNILARVIETYGGLSVECPVLGEIPLSKCVYEQKQGFSVGNSQRVALFRACKNCSQNRNRKGQ